MTVFGIYLGQFEGARQATFDQVYDKILQLKGC
jgi:hypothetical protein